ncbi:carboxyl transferase domain-containing protein [Streptomyces nodosus]|uniref:carboxyl transferase domain-containing protein n=1 Tax=Streptomyces nodosus TaxID=40318 RepID=UPI00382F570A
MSPRPAALDFADTVLDHGSHRSWDTPAPAVGGDYGRTLERARERSGADEAVLTGEGRIAGRRVALLLGEFAFLAGSVGTVAADRLVRAVRRATAERLPVLAAPVSGGTRMQEGTPAFVRMAGIAAALAAHRAAHLPYLVHLRHPTTGGVLASWGSLGQLTTAEPGALIGFLGPRVYEAMHAAPFPAGVQRAENLAQHGVIDAVLSPGQLRDTVAATLDITDGVPHGGPPGGRPQQDPLPPQDIWRSVGLTRDPRRPGLAELLAAADAVVPLGGTGAGEREDALRIALARIGGAPCVVAGHDRSAPGSMGPAGLRTARRAMRLAVELRLPLLTVIDTAGARLTPDAEEGALAGEIARSLADLSRLTVPRLSLLLGEGAGGAALALLPADRTLAAEHAWLSPLPPEGASAILYRTTARAAELAQEQRIGAAELLDDGIVHRILAEPVPAGEDRDGFTARLVAALGWELRALHRAARAAGATGAAA